jgi:hypothetical protein
MPLKIYSFVNIFFCIHLFASLEWSSDFPMRRNDENGAGARPQGGRSTIFKKALRRIS